eukprot:jgi/Chrzof1/5022/Cz15g08250.t1
MHKTLLHPLTCSEIQLGLVVPAAERLQGMTSAASVRVQSPRHTAFLLRSAVGVAGQQYKPTTNTVNRLTPSCTVLTSYKYHLLIVTSTVTYGLRRRRLRVTSYNDRGKDRGDVHRDVHRSRAAI